MIKKLFSKVPGIPTAEERKNKLYYDLLRHEGRIGGTLFGPVPKGTYREFFCLDEHTWVWHEEWKDESGSRKIRNTRYDVRPDGIVKSQNGKHYQRLTDREAIRLLEAAKAYEKRVTNELYQAVA